MTNRTHAVVRHWPRRAAVVTGVTLVLSLSASPGAHADGLLDDVTEVVGGVTQPVVQPVVQTVQTAVPQPVQQAVEPVVTQVVEPTLSQTEQSVESIVRSAEQTVQPVVKPPEPAVRPAPQPDEDPVAETGGRGAAPAEAAPAPAPAPAPGAQAPPAPGGSSVPGAGPGGSPAVDEAGHRGSEPSAAAVRGPRHDGRHATLAHRDPADLAPREASGSVAARRAGLGADPSAAQELWNLTNALMHMWAGSTPGSVDAGLRGDGAADAGALGASDTVPLLLGLLLAWWVLTLARRRAA